MFQDLINILGALTIGIFLGWFLLPQPAWAKPVWDLVVGKLKTLIGFVKNTIKRS